MVVLGGLAFSYERGTLVGSMDYPPRFVLQSSSIELRDMTELSTDETALLDHLFIFDLRGGWGLRLGVWSLGVGV